MARVRITFRDSELAHQIILNHTGGHLVVSCNCLETRPAREPNGRIMGGAGKVIARIKEQDDVWEHYNDPAKHDNSVEEFIPRSRHTMNARVFDVP